MPQWAEQSGASILQLARLQPDEIRRLVNTIAAEHKMPTSVVDAIVARSDGIPIFAEELARGLQAMEDAAPGTADATAIPVTLERNPAGAARPARAWPRDRAACGRDRPRHPARSVDRGVAVRRGRDAREHRAPGRKRHLRHAPQRLRRRRRFPPRAAARRRLSSAAAARPVARPQADRRHHRGALSRDLGQHAARAGAPVRGSRRPFRRHHLSGARRARRGAPFGGDGSGRAFHRGAGADLQAAAGTRARRPRIRPAARHPRAADRGARLWRARGRAADRACGRAVGAHRRRRPHRAGAVPELDRPLQRNRRAVRGGAPDRAGGRARQHARQIDGASLHGHDAAVPRRIRSPRSPSSSNSRNCSFPNCTTRRSTGSAPPSMPSPSRSGLPKPGPCSAMPSAPASGARPRSTMPRPAATTRRSATPPPLPAACSPPSWKTPTISPSMPRDCAT